MQAKLMWFMPLAFSVMFFFFPSGLVLYWITNNVLSIAQQWIINTRMGVPPQFNLPKFKLTPRSACGASPQGATSGPAKPVPRCYWTTHAREPIAAIATAPGRGAVGIVRVSGHGSGAG
jgi:membrane protein insertase Oxa1/YidC/SpoIIIJ